MSGVRRDTRRGKDGRIDATAQAVRGRAEQKRARYEARADLAVCLLHGGKDQRARAAGVEPCLGGLERAAKHMGRGEGQGSAERWRRKRAMRRVCVCIEEFPACVCVLRCFLRVYMRACACVCVSVSTCAAPTSKTSRATFATLSLPLFLSLAPFLLRPPAEPARGHSSASHICTRR